MSAHCHICWHAFDFGDEAFAAVAPDGEQFVLLCKREIERIPPAFRHRKGVADNISIRRVTAQYQPPNPLSPHRLMIFDTVKLAGQLFNVSRSDFARIPNGATPPPLPWR